MKYYRALISARTEKEAKTLVTHLAKKKLIAGAMLTSGPAMYWWENKIAEKKYWNISAFTKKSQIKKIIQFTKKVHLDQVPIISFYEISIANKDFLKWINNNTSF